MELSAIKASFMMHFCAQNRFLDSVYLNIMNLKTNEFSLHRIVQMECCTKHIFMLPRWNDILYKGVVKGYKTVYRL